MTRSIRALVARIARAVRGTGPLENLHIVDNVEIPRITTLANFASAGGTVTMVDVARDWQF